jgi:hypothetical protein
MRLLREIMLRLIESDMAAVPDPEDLQIHGILSVKCFIAAAFLFQVFCIASGNLRPFPADSAGFQEMVV